jgi:adenine-specific DNA-methyltransferase
MSMEFTAQLKEVLKQDKRLFTESGELLRNAAVELAHKMDTDLLRLLLADTEMKAHFFTDVDGVLVFDSQRFAWVVSNREFLPDSFTRFRSSIGLVDAQGRSISQSSDVELVWPFKDCVLAGGQTKEEERRQEVFYNETLAPDEVNRLLSPKVLTKATRYDKDGNGPTTDFGDDGNLIIKGNNLLVLSSLLPRFRGRVKTVFIDPPYNTENDGFRYNDRFTHSTWLTFMTNRLGLLRELLSDDGSLWLTIDDNEGAYLKVLCDEVFGRENFIVQTTIQRSGITGHKAINPTPVQVCDYVLAYAKNRGVFDYHPVYVARGYDTAYNSYIANYDDDFADWSIVPLKPILKERGLDAEQAIRSFPERIVRLAAPDYNAVGQETQALIDVSTKDPSKVYRQEREKHADIYLKAGQRILFYKDKMRKLDGKLTTTELASNLWSDISFQGIAKEGGITLKKGKKPEALIRRILEMSSDEGDLILDCFAGSGTTAAVALKMGRQFIVSEQMDYVESLAVKRLEGVVNGDQTGISKAYGWKGGGSFVYCQLKQLNQAYAERIQDAEKTEELLSIWEELKDTGFISHRVEPEKFDPEAFKALDIAEQRALLMLVLDKNQLYVNLSDIDDADYGVSDADRAFNGSFYGSGE